MKKIFILLSLIFILSVQSNAQSSFMANFSWTAPVEDHNDSLSGACSYYELKMTTDTLLTWSEWAEISGTGSPKEPGELELYTILINDLEPQTRYYFAIVACDVGRYCGERSNIIYRTTIDNIRPATIVIRWGS